MDKKLVFGIEIEARKQFNAEGISRDIAGTLDRMSGDDNDKPNFYDCYAAYISFHSLLDNEEHYKQVQTALGTDKSKNLRSVGRYMEHADWGTLQTLRKENKTEIPPQQGINFTKQLCTLVGSPKEGTHAEPTQADATKIINKLKTKRKSGGTAEFSQKTIDDFIKRLQKLQPEKWPAKEVGDAIAALRKVKAIETQPETKTETKSDDKPTPVDDPVATLAQKLEIQEQRMSKMMEFIESKMG